MRKAVLPMNNFIKAIAENRAFKSEFFENPIRQVDERETKYCEPAFNKEEDCNDGAIDIATAPAATETVSAATMLFLSCLPRRRRCQQRRPQEERRRRQRQGKHDDEDEL